MNKKKVCDLLTFQNFTGQHARPQDPPRKLGPLALTTTSIYIIFSVLISYSINLFEIPGYWIYKFIWLHVVLRNKVSFKNPFCYFKIFVLFEQTVTNLFGPLGEVYFQIIHPISVQNGPIRLEEVVIIIVNTCIIIAIVIKIQKNW